MQPSDKQINFIKSLAGERRLALTPAPSWLRPPTTSAEASVIIGNLMKLPKDPKAARPELVAKVDKARNEFSSIPARSQSITRSFIQQFDAKGDLSPNQEKVLDTILATIGQSQAEPERGFYDIGNGYVVMVYLTRRGHASTKTYVPGADDWIYTGQGGFKDCTPDTKMTAEQVAEMGRRISEDGQGLCVVCLAEGRDPRLTDERSVAAGYGETCARNQGWHYPTKEEARAILANR